MAVTINERIAARLRDIRTGHGLSLEALARRSGVSRSMISLIERGESSPTAILLEKLATGLGVTLAALFELPARAPEPLSRRASQVEWRDPGSGYRRRNLSPSGFPSPIQMVEITFPPGAQVAFETGARRTATHQQVWVLQGRMEVTLGEARFALGAGDCLAFLLDRPVAYRNPTSKPARYLVVIVAAPSLG